jgi:hypothetical protein
MIAIHQKLALATVALASLGMLGTQAYAGQPKNPNSGFTPIPVNNFRGAITGKISFAQSLLGSTAAADPCRDFRVDADMPAKPTPAPTGTGIHLSVPPTPGPVEAKSAAMTEKTKGSSIECIYSIPDLSAARFTVVATGHPRGFKAPAGGGLSAWRGGFSPQQRNVRLKRQGIATDSVTKVNFVFKLFEYSPNGGN